MDDVIGAVANTKHPVQRVNDCDSDIQMSDSDPEHNENTRRGGSTTATASCCRYRATKHPVQRVNNCDQRVKDCDDVKHTQRGGS